jgi:DNA modification methylase
MLAALGWHTADIEREPTLIDPKTGAMLRPDYLLKSGERCACVIESKKPAQNVLDADNIAQAYCYAAHINVRAHFYALCNGKEFALWLTLNGHDPKVHFPIAQLRRHWQALRKLMAPRNILKYRYGIHMVAAAAKNMPDPNWDYNKRPLMKEIEVHKRAVKRHNGVHPYFTSQAWNVVAEYIKNFSQPDDVVLDPYGGKGVTIIEALLNGRSAIHVDINPMANFMVEALLVPTDEAELRRAFDEIKSEYLKKVPSTDEEIQKALAQYPLPKDLPLPKGSDVPSVRHLFSPKQMACLALLKYLINKQKNSAIRKTLLLMFAGTISEVNLMAEAGSNAIVMKYYRYRIAPRPKMLEVFPYFETSRFNRILAAKKEIAAKCNMELTAGIEEVMENATILHGSATNLNKIDSESVDYIYTDPPYGNKIQYLDLSTMWNAWLDLEVTEEDYQLEAIEDGSHEHTFEDYKNLITKSLEEMFRVLKFDRWMSFVFAHKDPKFWHVIVDAAKRCGFEYRGTVVQRNGPISFKKVQNPFTTLAGQLIINFYKAKNPNTLMQQGVGMQVSELIMQTLEGVIAKDGGATLEEINNELIIKGMNLGFLHLLAKEYEDIASLLRANFDYDVANKKYVLRNNQPFKTNMPLELRIRYYLISYFKVAQQQGRVPTLDEIVLDTIPRLKNGITPSEQDILAVLETIAERIGDNGWRMKGEGQGELFDS